MDLITLADLQDALGTAPAGDIEEATWRRSIATVSNFINSYCDTGFELVTDDVKRFKADWCGEIHLPKGPIHKVTSVVDFRYPEMGTDYYIDWDGMDTLFYALPEQVVIVTYTHGLDGAPQDVKDLVVEVCDNIIDGPEDIKQFQVGDVMEQLNPSFVTSMFGDIGNQILSQYGGGCNRYTIDTSGSGRYPDYNFHGYVNDSEN